MNLDLTNVLAKLTRSQEHLQTLKREMGAWIDRHPYSVTQQVNSDSTRYSLFIRENEAAPFLRWTLIFGDFLNNLRSALDYLVYTIAVFESKSDPPPLDTKLAFPLCVDQAEFIRRTTGNGKILGTISAPIQAVIEGLQPYNRPHKDLPPLLGILRDFNNRDKHRLIRLMYGAAWGGKIGLEGFHTPGVNVRFEPNTGELKDGAEVAAAIFDRSTPNMNLTKLEIVITINVWHGKRDESLPEWHARTECVALMELLSGEVRHVIYTFTKL